jgi:hypothetical protein
MGKFSIKISNKPELKNRLLKVVEALEKRAETPNFMILTDDDFYELEEKSPDSLKGWGGYYNSVARKPQDL